MKRIFSIFPCFIIPFFLLTSSQYALYGQVSAELDGYIFEANNRGYLNQVKVKLYEMPDKIVAAELVTDADGHFSYPLESGKTYKVACAKDIFHDFDTTFTASTGKNFLKIEMRRKPGYLFDVTLAEPRADESVVVDAIEGARVEIYNRTQKKMEMVLDSHPQPYFQFTFEQGNHYTLMIRKVGYLTKRIEAHVNIDGCIICIDGVSNLRPGVTENLTSDNTMGTLLANIEIERASVDKLININNIYYETGKWDITPASKKELDKVVLLMKDNPGITIELGSHTDARGAAPSNLDLSQKRADAAVAYIVSSGIESNRLNAKGFGESKLLNKCADGVTCSEKDHAINRRTELRITGVGSDDLIRAAWMPLETIVREEEFEVMMRQLGNQEEVKIGADGKPIGAENKNPIPVVNFPNPEGKTEEKPVLDNPPTIKVILEESPPDADREIPVEQKSKATLLKEFPKLTTGFYAQVATSINPLESTHPALVDFAEIFVLKNEKNGSFEYLIGPFFDKKRAEDYMNALPAGYPGSKIRHFVKGKEMKI